MRTEQISNKISIKSYSYVDLFAGIGGFHSAADALGGHCVFASEIDEEAKRAYKANYGIDPFGDITAVDTSNIPVTICC